MSIEDLKRFFAFEADEPEHIDDIVALLEDRRAAIEEQRRTLDEAYAHVLRKLHYYGIRPISAAAARPPLRPFSDTAPAGIHGKNNETAYCLSSLWTTRLLSLPPKVQTHLMPSHAAVTGTANAFVPVPETLIEANQGFLARQHQAVSTGTARVFDDGAHEAARRLRRRKAFGFERCQRIQIAHIGVSYHLHGFTVTALCRDRAVRENTCARPGTHRT